MRHRSTLLCFIAVLILSGCFGVTMKRPSSKHSIELPELWQSASEGDQGKISTGWVKTFNDSEMEKFIETALKNNPNLQEAAGRLKAAKQGAIIGRAARFPSLGFGGSGSRTQRIETTTTTPAAPVTPTSVAPAAATPEASANSTTTTPSTTGTAIVTAPTTGAGSGTAATTPATSNSTMTDAAAMTAATAAAPMAAAATKPVTTTNTVRTSDYGLSLDASWEMDLWGRLRDLDHAAYEDLVAAQADFRAARLSLAANTAKAWFNLIAARQQLELAEDTRDSYQRNYRITERNYKAGDDTASPLDVQFGRNNVASAERTVVTRRLAYEQAARALEILIGTYPSGKTKGRSDLPKLSKKIPSGLPSDLLARRPDLVAAEAALRASAKRANAARKNLLPSFVMTGSTSTSSDALTNILIDPEAIVWNAASRLAQSIFEGGALTAEAKRMLAQNEIAIRRYASLVLQALSEVESALATEQSLAEQEKYLDTELRQANLAERQADRDYSEGIVGILEVLEAQRRAVDARNAMIQLRNQRLQNRIDLHLALGGDFSTEA
jgi:multidrug efflux system outer membrane protein